MYTKRISERNNIEFDWKTLYVGKKLHKLLPGEIERYAVKYLVNHPDETSKWIVDLACGSHDYEVDDILDKVIISLGAKAIMVDSYERRLE